jgi:DNA-binding HxlR family transcriptional regulator
MNEKILNLIQYKWANPIILFLLEKNGSKLVTIQKTLSISRDSLRRTLGILVDKELIQRNSGYGHPMRPEYVLTKQGAIIGKDLLNHKELFKNVNYFKLIGSSKWTLQTLLKLKKHSQFNDLKKQVQITSRSLSLTLKNLEEQNYVTRKIESNYPPTISYLLSRKAEKVLLKIGL